MTIYDIPFGYDMATFVTNSSPSSSLQSARDRARAGPGGVPECMQRQAAEILVRELAKVLQEVATLFDGARLEALRRSDPKVPMYWTPDDWRIFFAKTPLPGINTWGSASNPRVAELERTIAELMDTPGRDRSNAGHPLHLRPIGRSSRPQFGIPSPPNAGLARIRPNKVCPLHYRSPLTCHRI